MYWSSRLRDINIDWRSSNTENSIKDLKIIIRLRSIVTNQNCSHKRIKADRILYNFLRIAWNISPISYSTSTFPSVLSTGNNVGPEYTHSFHCFQVFLGLVFLLAAAIESASVYSYRHSIQTVYSVLPAFIIYSLRWQYYIVTWRPKGGKMESE